MSKQVACYAKYFFVFTAINIAVLVITGIGTFCVHFLGVTVTEQTWWFLIYLCNLFAVIFTVWIGLYDLFTCRNLYYISCNAIILITVIKVIYKNTELVWMNIGFWERIHPEDFFCFITNALFASVYSYVAEEVIKPICERNI